MPRFDKTGPEGKGEKTGRGQGDCEPKKKKVKDSNPAKDFENSFNNERRGRGAGRGPSGSRRGR